MIVYFDSPGPYPKTLANIEEALYTLPYVIHVTLGGHRIAVETEDTDDPGLQETELSQVIQGALADNSRFICISSSEGSLNPEINIDQDDVTFWCYRGTTLEVKTFSGLHLAIDSKTPINVRYREMEPVGVSGNLAWVDDFIEQKRYPHKQPNIDAEMETSKALVDGLAASYPELDRPEWLKELIFSQSITESQWDDAVKEFDKEHPDKLEVFTHARKGLLDALVRSNLTKAEEMQEFTKDLLRDHPEITEIHQYVQEHGIANVPKSIRAIVENELESCDCDRTNPHDCVCPHCRMRWLKHQER